MSYLFEVPSNLVYVASRYDFPASVSGVITLEDNTTYLITDEIDLGGDRIVISGSNTTLLGTSSETSFLTSSGIGTTFPTNYLIESEYTLPIRHITFKDIPLAIGINTSGLGVQPIALDWTGVNFSGTSISVTCGDIDNFIFSKGAILSSGGFVFEGDVGTIGIDNSLFVGTGGAYNLIELTATANVTRRFRTIYSSFVAFSSTGAVNVDPSATIPTEGFILDTVNFSGGSTYLPGLDETSNDSLFVNCVGIVNTAVNGQLYMQNNSTATTVSATNTFYKVAGTTTPSADNAKYLHSNNRLTCDAEIERKYLIQCNLSFTSGNNQICKFGFYDSKLGTIRTPSTTTSKANSSGRAENISFMCVVQHSQGDYLEVHCANTSAVRNITVTDLNFVITEIK